MWLLIAGAVGLLSWWLTGRLASHSLFMRLIDHPNERSLHALPTPRTGGIGILASAVTGVVAVSVWTFWMGGSDAPMGQISADLGWILGAALFLSIVSLLDDRNGLPVFVRLGAHLLAACGVVFGGDVIVRTVPMPMWGLVDLGWTAAPVTFIFLLWMTNLYNFMDGMDGFAGGMTVMGFGLVSYLAWLGHHPVILVLAMMQAAAATGFLMHNFPPARIFMGDVGSISTGFLAGSLAVLGSRDGVFELWIPIMIFSPFILDATGTLIRRTLRGCRIWEPHREHYYQRLVLNGWGHRKTVLAEYELMMLCGVLALLYQRLSGEWRPLLLMIWGAVFIALALAVNVLERKELRRAGDEYASEKLAP